MAEDSDDLPGDGEVDDQEDSLLLVLGRGIAEERRIQIQTNEGNQGPSDSNEGIDCIYLHGNADNSNVIRTLY